MDDLDRGRVSRDAAEVYDALFVPALFEAWAGPVAEAARIAPGERVLDVACGTGVLARAAAERAAPGGLVVGLDSNPSMLALAKRRAPSLDWREGRAESLPFEAAAFDAVVSQFGLMFFDDPAAGLREMKRVLAPAGRLVVAVWGPLDESPGYAALASLLARLFGEEAARALDAPFALGDPGRLASIVGDAGLEGADVVTRGGRARFPSIRSWVTTEIRGWTLAERLDEDDLERLAVEAERGLARFAEPRGGAVSFPISARLVTLTSS